MKRAAENGSSNTGGGFFHSISFKIIITIIFTAVLTVGICMFTVIPKSKTALITSTKESLLYLAEAERSLLEYAISDEGATTEQYAEILADVKIDGVESSYAYLVAPDGIMLYHKTADKVGVLVENAVVTDLVARIAAGEKPEDNVIGYEFKGVKIFAAYAITDDNKILVLTADEEDILSPINEVTNVAVTVSSISILLLAVFGFFMGKAIGSPIEKMTVIIRETSTLNFKHNQNSEKLRSRKDETGDMARAVHDMRDSLRGMVHNIEDAKSRIANSVNELQTVSNVVNRMCMDNSATTQQLAAGMEETSATAETINGNIGYIQNGASDIHQLSVEGAKLSEEVMSRANALRSITMEASQKTNDIYSSVKIKADTAMEGSKAVDKINELTEAIMAISSQTSLLALNASIEAARAGEAGRGFAVVATEIGNLAVQTSQSVRDINSIVGEVNTAVNNMAECLEDTTGFLEKTVLNDYSEFMKVGEQYNEDASVFRNSMMDINNSIVSLTETIDTIADALSGITSTVSEATVGVTDIAEKTSDMVMKSTETYELAEESLSCTKQLEDIVNVFVL